MEYEHTQDPLSTGPMADWRIYSGYGQLARGLAFPLVFLLLVTSNFWMGSFEYDIVDIIFFLFFGYVIGDRFLTFAWSHNRRYIRVPQASIVDVAKAVEKALDGKFITYRKKGVFPPTRVRGNRYQARYVLATYDVTVVLTEGHRGSCVCIGPENARTEEQMIQLVIAISNNLSRLAPSEPGGPGPRSPFSEMEGL